MRFRWHSALVLAFASVSFAAQEVPVTVAAQTFPLQRYDFRPLDLVSTAEFSPPIVPRGAFVPRMATLVRKEVKKEVREVVDQSEPSVEQWHPLTPGEKFQVFVRSTYAPSTFAGAAFDAAADRMTDNKREYETGFAGACQRFSTELAANETDVFFQRFLVPTLLRQDPRYFRNPNLPFFKRAMYSVTRVVITRSDSGHSTFNFSYVLGSAASQAIRDLYAPGARQGFDPIADRLTFNLAIDAGFNLFHEFWPDVRHKLFHRPPGP